MLKDFYRESSCRILGVQMGSSLPPLSPNQLNYSESSQWKKIIRQAVADLRVSLPGIVASFDPGKQTAAVDLAIREKVVGVNGVQDVTISTLYDVPVVLPRAGGFSLTLPLQQGDECLVIFSDMCIDYWWQNGGVQNQLEQRRHDLSDCFCVPGPWSQPRIISNYSTTSAQLRSDDGNIIIDISENGVTISADKMIINTTGDTDITAQGNVNVSASGNVVISGRDFLSHKHSGVQAGGADTGGVV